MPPAELWITALSDLEILKFDSERNPPGKENKKSAGIKYKDCWNYTTNGKAKVTIKLACVKWLFSISIRALQNNLMS